MPPARQTQGKALRFSTGSLLRPHLLPNCHPPKPPTHLATFCESPITSLLHSPSISLNFNYHLLYHFRSTSRLPSSCQHLLDQQCPCESDTTNSSQESTADTPTLGRGIPLNDSKQGTHELEIGAIERKPSICWVQQPACVHLPKDSAFAVTRTIHHPNTMSRGL